MAAPQYVWSPDYSQFIDARFDPGVSWYAGDPNNPDVQAGFRRMDGDGNYMPSWQEGAYVSPQTTTFRNLQEAGLWNLNDPNSPAWALLKSKGLQGLGSTDVSTKDPAQVAANVRSMLAGQDPAMVEQVANAEAAKAQQYWDSIKGNDAITPSSLASDLGDTLEFGRDVLTQTPLGAAALGALGGYLFGPGGTTLPASEGGAFVGASPFTSGLDSAAIAGTDFSGAGLAGAGAGAGSNLADFANSPFTSGLDANALANTSFGGDFLPASGDWAGLTGPAASGESLLGPATGSVESAPVINPPLPQAAPLPAAPQTLADLTATQGALGPGSLEDVAASGGASVPPAAQTPLMPPAQPQSIIDMAEGGLEQTGPGQFEQLPMTAGGAGSFQGTSGLGAAATAAGGGIAAPNASGGGTTPTPASSPLSNILGGNAGTQDWTSLLGALGAAGLGAAGANQQTQAYKDLANQYMAMGAPYRQRLSDLYANPSSYLSSSEVQVPVQQGTDALARALSIKGNPAGSGSALQELQNYSANQLYGRLGEEKNRLAGFGGLTQYNAAAPQAAAQGVNASGGVYNALGYGLGQLTQPRNTGLTFNLGSLV